MQPIFKKLIGFIDKNKSTIMTVVACIGVPGTAILASKATLDSDRQLRKLKHKNPNPSKLEIVKEVGPNYIPSLIVCGTTIGCMVGSNNMHAKREAALTSAYVMSDKAFREYKDKVIETFGERKNDKIEHEAMQSEISKKSIESETVIDTRRGDTLCFDSASGRYFKSDIETLRRIQNDANEMLLDSGWVSLNDIYYLIGLKEVCTAIGDELGWDLQEKGLIDFRFGSALTDDGNPCVTLNFDIAPKYFRY